MYPPETHIYTPRVRVTLRASIFTRALWENVRLSMRRDDEWKFHIFLIYFLSAAVNDTENY
jgi:hypothetical protein